MDRVPSRPTDAELRKVVAKHAVTYEVSPSQVPRAGELRTIGYDLRLTARHSPPLASTTPGCAECIAVWQQLCTIVEAVLPERRHSSFSIRHFDSALHIEPRRSATPEVELVLEVRHQTDYEAPADPCEAECLAAIIQGLKRLGMTDRKSRTPG